MPQRPPAPNPAPPMQDDCQEDRVALAQWRHAPHWRCGHARRDKYKLAHLSPSECFEECARCFVGPQIAAEELLERSQECPACAASTRRTRGAWAALALATFVLFSVRVAACWGAP
jgi:hypothetical protein